MLKDASDSRPTLQAETLELLPNIMEGAVRECPCCQATNRGSLISEFFTHLHGKNTQMQGKSLFELHSKIFISTNLHSRTYKLARNGKSNATW